MSISNITVTSNVDGNYTLAELLELLGSSAKTKKALASLEDATKTSAAALKATAKARQAFDATILGHNQDVARDFAALAAKLSALEGEEAKVKAAKEDATEHEAAVKDMKQKIAAYEADLKARERGLEHKINSLVLERKEFEANRANALDDAEYEKAKGLKMQAAAKKAMAKAEEKVAALKKALG